MSGAGNIVFSSGGPTPTPGPTSTPTPTPGSRSAFSQIEAESYNSQSGIQTESCGEGGQDVGFIENGDYVVYNSIDFGSGATGFQARVASATSGGNIEIRLDSTSGTLVGTCSVAGTGGWQTWTTRTCTVSGASGTHNLYLRFTGGSGYLMNINWFKFTTGTVTPTPSATPTVRGNTPTATPTPTTGMYVRFRNVATSLYIDGMGSTSNGANCCQWGNSGSNNQQWTLEAAGGNYKIKNRATGLYLDGMGRTSNGSICGQWSSSASTNQQWVQETVGSNFKYKNVATGLYLDGMGSTGNGSNLCQWSSSSSTNQQWQIVSSTATPTPTPTPTRTGPTPTRTTGSKFHCFLLLGQSNMAGYALSQAADKVEDPRVLVLGYDNNPALGRVTDQWDVACPPLHPAWLDCIGPGDWFGKTIVTKIPAGDTIGLIPCAISGEGIETFMKVGGTKYSWIINRARLAQQAGGVIEGFLFHQGESNNGDPAWPGKVKTFVTDLRADLGLGNVPFLAGELLYGGACAGHNTLVNQLPSLITNCYVVSASGLVKDPSDTYNMHFGHDSSVELGKRYAAKMITALGW